MPVSEKKYAVVTFLDEDACEVIPTSWMASKTETRWPNISSSSLVTKLIADCAPPSTNWMLVKIKTNSFTNSFSKAKRKATQAMETSNLSSDSEAISCSLQRKRQKPARYVTKETSSVKRVRLDETESSASESDSVISSKKQYTLPSLPQSGELTTGGKSKPVLHSQNLISKENTIEKVNSSAFYTDIYNILGKMNKKIGDLSSEVRRLSDKIDNITNSNANVCAIQELPEEINLPITSDEGLHQLNENLKRNKNLSATLVRFLYNSGNGRTERQFVLSLTKKVLAQEIAVQYSRFGRKGKKSFIIYNEILNVILATAAMKFSSATRDDLSEMFGKSLAGAKDWFKRQLRPSDVIDNCSLTLGDTELP